MYNCIVQAEQKQREELRKMVERRSAQERSRSEMEEEKEERGEEAPAVAPAVAPVAAAAVVVAAEERSASPAKEAGACYDGSVILWFNCEMNSLNILLFQTSPALQVPPRNAVRRQKKKAKPKRRLQVRFRAGRKAAKSRQKRDRSLRRRAMTSRRTRVT